MGQTGNSLVIVFSIVLLLSLVVLSFETAEAQKDPDKDKKKGTTDKGKYPYVEAVVECRDGIYWLVFYSVYGPKQKIQELAIKFPKETCPDPDPPKGDHPIIVLRDGAEENPPPSYIPPAFDATNSHTTKTDDLMVTNLPEIIAPVGKFVSIYTVLKNLKDPLNTLNIEITPIIPENVEVIQRSIDGPHRLASNTDMTINYDWRCTKPVTDAVYGYKIIAYLDEILIPGELSKARANAVPINLTNTITCLESVDQATGVELGASEDTTIILIPEVDSKTKSSSEKEKTPKKRGEGVEPQGILTASGNYLPPVKQMKMGITAEEVSCNEGKELIFKSSDGSPKCVSMVAAEKLVARGWATR